MKKIIALLMILSMIVMGTAVYAEEPAAPEGEEAVEQAGESPEGESEEGESPEGESEEGESAGDSAEEAVSKWVKIDLSLERPTMLTDTRDFERGGEVYYEGPTGDYYLYKASTWTMDAEATVPVFTYYTDYASEEEARQAMDDAGLTELAEELGAVVVMATSAGEEYSEEDVEIYKAIEQYLLYENLHGGTKSFGPGIVVENYYTYTQRDFVMAGDTKASDFLASYMTGYLNRIAGMILIGSDSTIADTDLPVAAYLVDCSEDTVEAFKALDQATEEVADGVFVNPTDDIQKVVAVQGQTLPEALEAFWNEIGVCTQRLCYSAMLFAPEGKGTPDPFSLTRIVIPEEIGVSETFYEMNGEYVPGAYIYVSDYAMNSTDEVFPMIMVFHGAGTPGNTEAIGDGFVTLASRENVIIVSLEYESIMNKGEEDGFAAAEDAVAPAVADMKQLYDYMVENYPVDVTRVFATGFSAGGTTSSYFAQECGDLLAGYITMHSNLGQAQIPTMPYMYVTGSADEASIDTTELIQASLSYFGEVNGIQDVNFAELETAKENGYGVPAEVGEHADVVANGENYHVITLFNAASQPTMQLAVAENVVHTCHAGLAPVIWDYMKQFSLVDGVRYFNEEAIQ